MSMQESKEEIRARLRSRRAGIQESDFYSLSAKIISTLRQQPEYQSAHTAHCYVSMNDRREVNTHPLIRSMLIEEGKDVVVPATHFKKKTLSHFTLSSFDDLAPNKWGVLEPEDGEMRAPSEFELVIVPMVGGDEQGQRVGYGGGYYDRFLKKVQCSAIGLCFEQNIVSSLPAENYDVPLDKIITEKRIIHRRD